jgi:hypothetical protein
MYSGSPLSHLNLVHDSGIVRNRLRRFNSHAPSISPAAGNRFQRSNSASRLIG